MQGADEEAVTPLRTPGAYKSLPVRVRYLTLDNGTSYDLYEGTAASASLEGRLTIADWRHLRNPQAAHLPTGVPAWEEHSEERAIHIESSCQAQNTGATVVGGGECLTCVLPILYPRGPRRA